MQPYQTTLEKSTRETTTEKSPLSLDAGKYSINDNYSFIEQT